MIPPEPVISLPAGNVTGLTRVGPSPGNRPSVIAHPPLPRGQWNQWPCFWGIGNI
jgi:hypothetical protein